MNNQNNVSANVGDDISEWLDKKVVEEDRSKAKIIRRLLRQEMERETAEEQKK